MAEMETKRSAHSPQGSVGVLRTDKRKRVNKKSTRVDLTPMVDLGFLLLTFFVFTTSLTEAKTMDLVMPYKSPPGDKLCQSCVLTVLLDKNSKIVYYEGALENNPSIQETGFGKEEIRTILMQKKEAVKMTRGNAEEFTLIIKASPSSNFKNFVDITDEVTICQITRYYIADLNEQDKNVLAKK